MKKIGMMNKHINDKIELPVSFRVFGIGDKTQSILDEINSWDYPGVKTLIWHEEEIIPSEEDEMVIFINPDNYDINALSKSFYDADILTLLVVSEGFKESNGCYDAFSITKGSDTIHTIFGILYPLFHHGFIAFDFYDIRLFFKGQGRFKVIFDKYEWIDTILHQALDTFRNSYCEWDTIARIALIFSINRKENLSLKATELLPIQELLSNLPPSVDIKWGFIDDNELGRDYFQMIGILSGKNLKF